MIHPVMCRILRTEAHTVVIATQDYTSGIPDLSTLGSDVAAALADISPTTRIVSLCTAAFVAAAFLLDGQRATKHLGMCAELTRRFPQVNVDESVLFVDNGRVLT